MPLDPSTRLHNRYRIDRLHKLGSMGAVYLAFDLELNVPVALKENLVSGLEYALQFRREAQYLSTFRHPNLPRATDHFVIEGQGQYSVMSFIEGTTALEWTASASKTPLEVISALEGVFEALMYIHSLTPPLIHRDVEPTNIIISNDLISFLVDFGLAKLLADTSAPGATDALSDQYSLAATIYDLVTHQPPANSLQRALGNEVLQPAGTLNPAVPRHVDAALGRALSIKAEDRYPDIEVFWQALTHEA